MLWYAVLCCACCATPPLLILGGSGLCALIFVSRVPTRFNYGIFSRHLDGIESMIEHDATAEGGASEGREEERNGGNGRNGLQAQAERRRKEKWQKRWRRPKLHVV